MADVNYPTAINPPANPLQVANEINAARQAAMRAQVLQSKMSGSGQPLEQLGAGVNYGQAQPNYPVEGQ
jgi:hypothetical protein